MRQGKMQEEGQEKEQGKKYTARHTIQKQPLLEMLIA